MPARPAAEPPRLCAAAVVLRRADPWLSETFEPWRVLLVRRGPSAPFDAGWWSAPCGGVESGDRSIAEAAARELDRATGWSLGLVFARGDLTLAEVQRVVLGKEAR